MSLNIMGENGEYTKVAGNSGGGASSADKISYDNTKSGIEATNVQSAIDTIKAEFYEEITHVNTSLADKISVPEMAEGQIATIGQVLAVKAVDEDGKPSEWEVVDQSGGGSNVAYFYKEGDEATISYANAFGIGYKYISVIGFFAVNDNPGTQCFGSLYVWVGGSAMDNFQVFYVTGTSTSNTMRNSLLLNDFFSGVVDTNNKTITIRRNSYAPSYQFCFTFM